MARVTCFNRAGSDISNAPVPDTLTTVEELSITIGGSASSAFKIGVALVEIYSDTARRVQFGTAPDGNGATWYIPANSPRQFGTKSGQKVIAVAV